MAERKKPAAKSTPKPKRARRKAAEQVEAPATPPLRVGDPHAGHWPRPAKPAPDRKGENG